MTFLFKLTAIALAFAAVTWSHSQAYLEETHGKTTKGPGANDAQTVLGGRVYDQASNGIFQNALHNNAGCLQLHYACKYPRHF